MQHADSTTRRNTPSHMDSFTSPTPTTSLQPQTLSLATSSRASLFLVSPPTSTHSDNLSDNSTADVRPLTWGYKFQREIARRMPHFRGEPPVLHPAFPPGGPASVIEHANGPIPFDTPRIVYSDEDERVLEEFTRAQGTVACSLQLQYYLFVRFWGQSPRAGTR